MTLLEDHIDIHQSALLQEPSSEADQPQHTGWADPAFTPVEDMLEMLSAVKNCHSEKSTPSPETVYTPHQFTTPPTTEELKKVVLDHLAALPGPSVSEVAQVLTSESEDVISGCAYRGDQGAMCAVGVLITNERFDGAALEGRGVNNKQVQIAIGSSIGRPLTHHEVSWLMKAQNTHDDRSTWTDAGVTPAALDFLASWD